MIPMYVRYVLTTNDQNGYFKYDSKTTNILTHLHLRFKTFLKTSLNNWRTKIVEQLDKYLKDISVRAYTRLLSSLLVADGFVTVMISL
jgi:hypothetical protein